MDIDVQNFKPNSDFIGDNQYSNFLGFLFPVAIGAKAIKDAKNQKKEAASNLEKAKQQRAEKDAELDAKVEEKRVANEKAKKDLQEAQKAAKIQADSDKVIADKKSEEDSVAKKARNKKLLIGGGILVAIIAAVVILKK
jgi:tRNA G10  N-methylase Trm11